MAGVSLPERAATPHGRYVLTGPLGILVAGAAIALAILAGLPIAVAVVIGIVAWAARVLLGLRKISDTDGINPFELQDPWRTFVWQAKRSQRQFDEAMHNTKDSALRDRLDTIADRIDTGVTECWRVAQAGERLTQARARIDVATITRDLSALPTGQPLQANPALADTARALQSQLDAAKRMDEIITSTRDRVRLLDARLGELVTRVIELSVRPQGLDDLKAVGDAVDQVVGEMETLRQGLDDSENAATTPSNLPQVDAVPPGYAPPPPPPSG